MIDEVGTLWIVHSPNRERFLDGTKDGRDYLGGKYVVDDVLHKTSVYALSDQRYHIEGCYRGNGAKKRALTAAKKYVDALNEERRSIKDIRYCYPENP